MLTDFLWLSAIALPPALVTLLFLRRRLRRGSRLRAVVGIGLVAQLLLWGVATGLAMRLADREIAACEALPPGTIHDCEDGGLIVGVVIAAGMVSLAVYLFGCLLVMLIRRG